MTLIFSMIVFALVGAITPGPVNLIATASALNFGLLRALPHVLGASVAYMVVVYLAGLGLSEWLLSIGEFQTALLWIGSAYLVYLGVKIAAAPIQEMGEPAEDISFSSKPPGFWSGALVQWLNPKAWLVASSGVSLFVVSHSNPNAALIWFCTVSLFVCIIGVGSWALMGQGLQAFLTKPIYQRVFNIVMALLLFSTVAAMLVVEYK
jgi:threonine/homoserine/homoserine lactone efflux protein